MLVILSYALCSELLESSCSIVCHIVPDHPLVGALVCDAQIYLLAEDSIVIELIEILPRPILIQSLVEVLLHCIVRIIVGGVQTEVTLLGSRALEDVQDDARVSFVIHYSIDLSGCSRTGQASFAACAA